MTGASMVEVPVAGVDKLIGELDERDWFIVKDATARSPQVNVGKKYLKVLEAVSALKKDLDVLDARGPRRLVGRTRAAASSASTGAAAAATGSVAAAVPAAAALQMVPVMRSERAVPDAQLAQQGGFDIGAGTAYRRRPTSAEVWAWHRSSRVWALYGYLLRMSWYALVWLPLVFLWGLFAASIAIAGHLASHPGLIATIFYKVGKGISQMSMQYTIEWAATAVDSFIAWLG
jgi:hypothetical protein